MNYLRACCVVVTFQGRIIPGLFKFHVLVTTFETIIADCELLSQVDWRICIIDEAHRLKNQKCKLIEGLRIFELEHKVLLTGTPLQVTTWSIIPSAIVTPDSVD